MSQVKVVRLDTDSVAVPLAEVAGNVKAVLWPGMGARQRQLFHFDLRAGGTSIALRHASEAVYYVIEGAGQVINTDTGEVHRVLAGAMIYINDHQGYKLAGPCIFIGGPCPPDPTLTEMLRSKP